MLRSLLVAAGSASAVYGQTLSTEALLGSAAMDAPYGVALEWGADAYVQLRDLPTLKLTGFPLAAEVEVDLELDQFSVLGDTAIIFAGDRQVTELDVATFRGRVLGSPGSSVFLGVTPQGVNGLIRVGDTEYIVSSGPANSGLPTLVYDLTNMPEGLIEWTPFTCHADEMMADMAPAGPYEPSPFRDEPPCRRLDVAIETDYEFTANLFGGDPVASAAYATVLVAANNEVYSRDLNMTFRIIFLRTWTDSNDPWNQSSTGSQLTQFRDYWVDNHADIEMTSAHFFSGRGLGGGVAWMPGLCYFGFNYALSANLNGSFPYPIQNNSTQNWDLMVTAHEWGHTHNGPHTHSQSPPIDNCAGGNCSVTPHGTIMSYCHLCPGGLGNVRMEFHPQTINSYILPHMANPDTIQRCGGYDCPDPIPGDLNGDGTVDLEDLLILLGDFGCSGGDCAGDADGDGQTGISDLLIILTNFGM